MKISNPELKALVFDLVSFEDKVDENSQPQPRKYYPKHLVRGVLEVKQKLKDAAEIAIVPQEAVLQPNGSWLVSDVQWIKYTEALPEGFKPVGADRNTSEEVDISQLAVDAIRHYYDERQDIISVSVNTLDELEALIGKGAA